MNIVVVIQDREAIPVRAVAFATNWGTLDPGHLAGVLAHTDEIESCYDGFAAYRVEGGHVLQIRPNWWDEAHREIEDLDEEDRWRWRASALRLLPRYAFVWKDDLERRYEGRDQPRYGDSGMPQAAIEEHRRTALDFDPFIESPELRDLISEAISLLKPSLAGGVESDSPAEPDRFEGEVGAWQVFKPGRFVG